ncbi:MULTISPECIES: hypothetical protein [Nonomuraea]|uniref:Uncharacterized protein n=1 Tax=Nonomuraea mangrovi TaxID=2316207 RepID=A0ABW4SWQ5_9ACTN
MREEPAVRDPCGLIVGETLTVVLGCGEALSHPPLRPSGSRPQPGSTRA